MRTPLYERLNNKKEHLSFHTPAHNGGIVIDSRLDVTELSYSDNLLDASGVIQESQREVARAYGVENVLYSTAGATALIHTVIRALRQEGRFLLYGEQHKSVYNALRINGVSSLLYRGNDLESALKNSGAKVVVCTSPNYFGKGLPLDKIKQITSECGAILVIDASHGAHFEFSTKLPTSATKYGDLVIHSQHKVMSTLTGGASLCYKDEYKQKVLRAFREIHTTSPNYLVMLSIENAVKQYYEGGEQLFNKVITEIDEFKKKCVGSSFRVIPTDDPTRLVIEVKGSGEETLSALEDLNIYPEMVYGNLLVFIVTPYNCLHLDCLFDALSSITYKEREDAFDLPTKKECIELFFGDGCEEVPLEESVGRVSYGEVGLYPPGVPIVVSGEVITKDQVNFLKEHFKGIFGLENGKVVVVK